MKKKAIIVLALILLCGIGITGLFFATTRTKQNTAQDYKKKEIIKKSTENGFSESGNIDVGTSVQSFPLDISEFSGEGSFSMEGMMGMPGMQTEMTFGNTGSANETRQLVVEDIYVEAGSEIKEGNPILKLTQDSVESIRSELEEDVSSAELVYQQALTAGKQTQVTAKADYDIDFFAFVNRAIL